MLYYALGSKTENLSYSDIRNFLFKVFDQMGSKNKVLVIPPDYTRVHSKAGLVTQQIYEYYGENLTDVLPAIGTHAPMTREEISIMFGNIPQQLFRVHRWREDLQLLGEIPAELVSEISEGKVNFHWPVQINKKLLESKFDLILSLGQVAPHEVTGMANYNKNILVGVGGPENIHKSHFLSAVYGMERIMGKIDNPARKLLNHASELYLRDLPVVYILTVVSQDKTGKLVIRGLYIGDDEECFRAAAELSQRVNFEILEQPLKKVVVYLNPQEFKSTWLGNKSIYRTRMAIADRGELVVMAPGIHTFSEDPEIDYLIRKYGYSPTSEILDLVEKDSELRDNLAAAAHLIHGSSEERFTITYCPGHLQEQDIRSVNFRYADLDEMLDKYHPDELRDGFNIMDSGEEIFYISNPAFSLWAYKGKISEIN
jgi:nickel-dependent lactate racemase